MNAKIAFITGEFHQNYDTGFRPVRMLFGDEAKDGFVNAPDTPLGIADDSDSYLDSDSL